MSTIHSFQIHEITIDSSRLGEEVASHLADSLPAFTALRVIELWELTIDESSLVRLVEACRSIRAMKDIT